MPNTIATLPSVVENSLVFWLPFHFHGESLAPSRLEPETALTTTEGLLQAHSSGKLCDLADNLPAELDVWRQLDRTETLNKLNGDLYPVAGNILCGKLDNPATGRPSFVLNDRIDKEQQGESLRALLRKQEIYLDGKRASNGLPLMLKFQDAWIRMFGSCFGLLAIQVVIEDSERADGTVSAKDLLQALHSLAQPPKRNSDLLSTRNRYSVWTSDQEIKLSAFVVVDADGRLSQIDIGSYAKSIATEGAIDQYKMLYRCVSCSPIAFSGTNSVEKSLPFRIVLEQVEAAELAIEPTLDGQPIKKGRRVRMACPDQAQGNPGRCNQGTWRAVDKNDPCATHQTLQAPDRQTGRCWVEALPKSSSFMDWIFALLPDLGGTLRPAIGDAITQCLSTTNHVGRSADCGELAYASWRLFSYAAVRFADSCTENADSHSAFENAALWKEYAFRLARRFGDDYLPTQTEIDKNVFAPFEAVYHSVATQGAALVIRDGGVDFLKTFIANTYSTAYRPIAEICYHEYLYLLHLVQDSAILPRDQPNEREIALLEGLIHALTKFRLYYRFVKISHMSQHNQVLTLWRNALGLDEIELSLARDVAEAHRALKNREKAIQAELDAIQTTRENAREMRWRIVGLVGIASAAFLSAIQFFDALATYKCPPETLQVALTDAQINGATMLPLIPELLKRPELGGDESMNPMDRLCSTPHLLLEPTLPSNSGAVRDPLDIAITNESSETYRLRLKQICTSTQQARVCASRATSTRSYALWGAIISMLFAVLIAWFFLPRPQISRGSLEKDSKS